MMLSAVVAMTLAAGDAPVVEEPQLHVVAQLGVAGGARAVGLPEAPFFFGLEGLVGLRFDPVRFGASVRGLVAARSGLDVGGFFVVDVVRLKFDSLRSLAVFAGVEAAGRWVPARATPWSAVVLGQLGVRVLGVSLAVVGGAEVPSGIGDGEVRLGVDFVEVFAR